MAGTITHEWDGTTLIITSDSGTSSCDLKGDKGDMGIRGAQGATGKAFEGISLYPIGSIYLSTVATSPASTLGGTWARLKDRFLLGAGDTYEAGAIGGEAEHTLTVAEMPKHNHSILFSRDESSSQWVEGYLYMPELADSTYSTNTSGTIDCRINVGTNGDNEAHNNMPPYLTVYMWQRIA